MNPIISLAFGAIQTINAIDCFLNRKGFYNSENTFHKMPVVCPVDPYEKRNEYLNTLNNSLFPPRQQTGIEKTWEINYHG